MVFSPIRVVFILYRVVRWVNFPKRRWRNPSANLAWISPLPANSPWCGDDDDDGDDDDGDDDDDSYDVNDNIVDDGHGASTSLLIQPEKPLSPTPPPIHR